MTTQIGMGTGKYPTPPVRTLIRVRAADVRKVERDDNDSDIIGLDTCLECWKLFMSADDRDLSASRMRLRAGDAADAQGYESDVYADQRIADMRIGAATSAMIESLKPAYRWAIYVKCSVATQWKFLSLDYITVAQQAMTELTSKLKKNIATATQFS